MATAYYYTFSKRHNSTAKPSTATGYIDVQLKGGCDILAPIFVLNWQGVPSFNYINFDTRYYFVTGVKSVREDLWEVSCAVDVLASWKSAIQAASPYVLYYTHNNTEIVDTRLSTKTSISIDTATETFHNLGTGESYMITAIGKDRTKIFACDRSDADAIFDSTAISTIAAGYAHMISDVTDLVDALTIIDIEHAVIDLFKIWLELQQDQGSIGNDIMYCDAAQKFVKNCFVLPIDKSDIGGSSERIRLGKWDSSAFGNTGFARIVHDSATLSIPWQASDWRRNEPYHEIYLYITYIGLIKIPASEIIGVNSITVNVAIDTYSGVASFVVNAANGTVIGQYSTNIAAQYALGSSNISLVESGAQIVSSSAAIVGGIATGNVPAAVMGALGIANSIKPFDVSVSSNGGAAGMGLGNTVKCITVFHDTTVAPSSVSSEKGTPYNATLSLSSVTGYVQTAGASVAGAMTDTEREQINELMNGGIYIE